MSVRTADVMAEPSPRWTRLVIVGVALVIAALVWITWQALRLEDRERAARRDAAFQESLRLALWRMDSALTPIIAREAARPYFEYQSFYPADRAMRSLEEPATIDDVLVPSPLLTASDPTIRVYFQREMSGTLTSPQAPQGWSQRVAEGAYVTPYVTEAARGQVVALRGMFENQQKTAAKLEQERIRDQRDAESDKQLSSTTSADEKGEQFADSVKKSGNVSDYLQRRSVASQAANVVSGGAQQAMEQGRSDAAPMNTAARTAKARGEPSTARPAAGKPEEDAKIEAAGQSGEKDMAGDGAIGAPPVLPGIAPLVAAFDASSGASDAVAKVGESEMYGNGLSETPVVAPVVQIDPAVRPGEFIAKWLPGAGGESELVFTREVLVGTSRIEQGFWVNWPLLREQVMSSARELLPAASLRPVMESPDVLPAETLGRMLASVPAELIVERGALAAGPAWSPLRSALLATWLVVLAAVVGLVYVARAATQLAERRGRFVSAVTHELRTPLTTFRMYSQMLADGMVTSQDAQRDYAKTLYDESGRLARIVESVLDYARLGKGKSQQPLDVTTVGEMLAGIVPGLQGHASVAGLTLDVRGLSDATSQRALATDESRVQRILLNVVENACKYARDSADKRIEFIVEVEHRDLRIRVRDFGPGVPLSERAAIFKPFTRGEAHAHGSVPGLGLGLALCRALAEQLGGSLALTGHAGGAEFTLTLPLQA